MRAETSSRPKHLRVRPNAINNNTHGHANGYAVNHLWCQAMNSAATHSIALWCWSLLLDSESCIAGVPDGCFLPGPLTWANQFELRRRLNNASRNTPIRWSPARMVFLYLGCVSNSPRMAARTFVGIGAARLPPLPCEEQHAESRRHRRGPVLCYV